MRAHTKVPALLVEALERLAQLGRRQHGRQCRRRPRAGSAPPGGAARLVLLVDRDLLAELLERAADETRDVHLRDADLLGDLRLRQAFEEAQVENRPLARLERAEARREPGGVLG